MTNTNSSLLTLAQEVDRALSYKSWSYWYGSYASHLAAWTREQTARDALTKAWQAASSAERATAISSASEDPGVLIVLNTMKETV